MENKEGCLDKNPLSGKSKRAQHARLHLPYLIDWPASET